MKNRAVILPVVAAALAALVAAPAAADLAMMKKAKELKIASVQSCQSCHVDKMPKKGAAPVNAMGNWLVDQKAARKAKGIDVAWLAEYKAK
jgi:mono/diheme cytochrome c family protein